MNKSPHMWCDCDVGSAGGGSRRKPIEECPECLAKQAPFTHEERQRLQSGAVQSKEHGSDSQLTTSLHDAVRQFVETLNTGLCPVPLAKLHSYGGDVLHGVDAILNKYPHPADEPKLRNGLERGDENETSFRCADCGVVFPSFTTGKKLRVRGDSCQRLCARCYDYRYSPLACAVNEPLSVPPDTLQQLHDCIDGKPGHDKFLLNVAVAMCIHSLNNHDGERFKRVMALAAHLHDFDVWNEQDRHVGVAPEFVGLKCATPADALPKDKSHQIKGDTDDDMWDRGYDDGFNHEEPLVDTQPYMSGYWAGRRVRENTQKQGVK